jgi:hypothetical protein
MPSPPVVLLPLTLPALLSSVLTSHISPVPTTLIICSSRESFLQALVRSLQQQGEDADVLERLLMPTLHNLSSARHVNLGFCTSVQALTAYLTAYVEAKAAEDGQEEKETLMLVNPLSLHAPTPSFSAQGLSRTFATAVETAQRVNARLVMVECLGMQRDIHYPDDDEDLRDALEEASSSPAPTDEDPWEQEVPILNVSARRFGHGTGERAWAGRTVKVKRIAARWFRFQKAVREIS